MIDITKKYRTRAGRKVRLISDQGTPTYPIIGVMEGDEVPNAWCADGRYLHAAEGKGDLVPDAEKVTKWFNVYKSYGGFASGVTMYDTEKEAKEYALKGVLSTCAVTFEVEN